jgi:hypothetical protein
MNQLAEDSMQLEDRLRERENVGDTDRFIESMRNVNTVRKTNSDIQKLQQWLEKQNEHREIETIPAQELDLHLARFFMTAKKLNGDEFELVSLKSIHGSTNRYLSEKHSSYNIVDDKQFKHSRDVVDSKRKLLRQHRKGNNPNKADPFSPEELQILYEKHLFGGGMLTCLNFAFFFCKSVTDESFIDEMRV